MVLALLQATVSMSSGLHLEAESYSNTGVEAVLANLRQSASDQLTGTAAPVSSTVASALEAQFASLEDEMSAEHTLQQGLADDLNAAIVACNAAMTTSFEASTVGVNHLKATAAGQIADHNTCRPQERQACGDFRSKAQEAARASPSCSNNYGATEISTNGQAEGVDDCLAEQETWLSTHQPTVDTARSNCTSKKTECDGYQTQGEIYFCEYKTLLVATCSSLDSCLAPAGADTLVTDRANKKEAVETMVNGLQSVYHAMQLAKCFVDLLKMDVESLTQAAIDDCNAMETDFDAHGLVVTFPTFVDEATCDVSPATPAPGDTEWVSTKYGNDVDDLLQPVTECDPAPDVSTGFVYTDDTTSEDALKAGWSTGSTVFVDIMEDTQWGGQVDEQFKGWYHGRYSGCKEGCTVDSLNVTIPDGHHHLHMNFTAQAVGSWDGERIWILVDGQMLWESEDIWHSGNGDSFVEPLKANGWQPFSSLDESGSNRRAYMKHLQTDSASVNPGTIVTIEVVSGSDESVSNEWLNFRTSVSTTE